jgi:hypothetical protein
MLNIRRPVFFLPFFELAHRGGGGSGRDEGCKVWLGGVKPQRHVIVSDLSAVDLDLRSQRIHIQRR